MIKQLEEKLHKEIPLTKFMNLKIDDYNNKELITSATLKNNINDKATAFGGSLSAITIISAWSSCWLIAKKLNISTKNIVIIKNETLYLKPVNKDIICHTSKPSPLEISVFKKKYREKGRASIKIESKVIEDNKICVEFIGIYVIS